MERVRSLMNNKENIRNISVISYGDSGKSTFIQNLKKCYNNNSNSNNSNNNNNNNSYLINLIDTPSHYDFQIEALPAFRITDGLLIVIDSVEYNYNGLESIQAILYRGFYSEVLRPVLFLNKLDRCILELKLDSEEIYQSFQRKFELLNRKLLSVSIVQQNNKDFILSPNKNNVAFGSGLHGWGFNIDNIARFYSVKFGIPQEKLVEKFWGENYYDPINKVWGNLNFVEIKDENGNSKIEKLRRGFCKYVMDPIYTLLEMVMADNEQSLKEMLSSIKVVLKEEEQKLKGVRLFNTVMAKWFPLADNVLSMCVSKLPSPVEAQRYRVAYLYEGPLDDECANAIRNCDSNGPLMMYISKMVPIPNNQNRFYAIGRIFSGVLSTNKKVNIMTSDRKSPTQSLKKPVSDIVFINNFNKGNELELIDDVPCGNIVGLIGFDGFLYKSGTISSSDIANSIRDIKLSSPGIVKVPVQPQNPGDLPVLIETLKKISKSNEGLQFFTQNTGENMLTASTLAQIESSLHGIENIVHCKVSKPLVSYRESVSEESSMVCMAKSPNRHNRIYMKCEPLSFDLENAIQNGYMSNGTSVEELRSNSKYLVENHNWDIIDSKKIWFFGPTSLPFGFGENSNCFVDQTKGVQYVSEYKDSMKSAFQWAVGEGALCEEPVNGVRFNLVDVSFFADAIHRGGGQIIPTTRRVIYASMLTASPILMEPWYLVEINTMEELVVRDVIDLLNNRRAMVINQDKRMLLSCTFSAFISYTIKAHIPVSESFGLKEYIYNGTGGSAYLESCIFAHYSSMGAVGYDENSVATQKVKEIRESKGMPLTIPKLDSFVDKL
ncbi:hypothetical protein DICPUDRAFT_89525 [Dictyostelium purpureum]|uniref:Tr-type G domain-containing protein n=1 Tax=Dictyostelium purpureum TaxID=5786 RepID=F0ZWF0_DICPU|nr:uncharacterized protein DICPUDRAFT_89525 [Dictyostelium purpureum]EGC31733.1 hypothetical protein DICPUDRAFT_89525 [Dictyostelium purpureum]|eukprot:XP_003291740.1 hypothetical protein DICPUDRAFT_89525 [Dictyostelium purpureum]